MDGSTGGFGGSRSEFLPGEGYYESDIKYQRYGGCFVSFKKGVAYVIVSLAAVAAAGILVFFYAPRWRDRMNNINSAEVSAFMDKMLYQPDTNIDEESKRLKKNIIPSNYQLYIQPYLEDADQNFTFEGNVSITFHVDESTKTILLHAKNLTIPEASVIVVYNAISTVEPLKSESQVKEDEVVNNETGSTSNNSTSDVSSSTAVTILPTVNVNTSTVATLDVTKNDTSSSDGVPTTLPPTSTSQPSNFTISNSNSSITSTTEPPHSSTASSVPSSSTTEEPMEPQQTIMKMINVSKQKYDVMYDRYVIDLNSKLEKGINYTLKLQFKGVLSVTENGFLRTSHRDVSTGKISWSAVTNLYPNSARMAFPCIDEPWYKAQFEIIIARKTNNIAISNMPKKESIPDESASGWIWDVFEKSPLMPTYSVAIIVSDLVSKKISSSEPGPVMNFWGRKDVQNVNYALYIAPKLLNFYNTFFGYHYPLTKIDFLAISNLSVKSVENWGLLSFRENIASVERDSSNYEKEELAKNMAYGLSRQWFNDLVTIRAWNESWIMEGLSTYMQYLGINAIESSWEILDDFLLTTTQEVLDAEYMNLKLTNYINIENDWDTKKLSFKKGCSIIRMLNNSLTDSVFIKGLRSYIDDWKYKNAEHGSLWNELTQVGLNSSVLPKDLSIQSMVDTWANQDGYPVITVTRNYEKGSAIIQQAPFGEEKLGNKKTWIMPMNYMTADSKDWNSDTKLWINKETTLIDKLNGSDSNKWILFNVQQTTLCRVNYDLKNWYLLTTQLQVNPEVLSPINRAQLIDDAFHLARNGLLDYGLVLNLTLYMQEKEKHYIPWAALLKNLEYLDIILSHTSNYGYFQDYVLKLLVPIYSELGTEPRENDSYSVIKLRALVIRWACKLNHKHCKDVAYSQFQTWANFTSPDDTNPTKNEMRASMYCVAVQMRGRSAWDFLWTRFKAAKNNENEAKFLLAGMGCSKDTWVLIRYFQRVINTTEITKKYSAYAWKSLSTDNAIDEAFEFLRDNWKLVYSESQQYPNLLKTIINGPLAKLSTQNEYDEVIRFFTNHIGELFNYSKDLARAAKKIQSRLTWKEKYQNLVVNWLRNQVNII